MRFYTDMEPACREAGRKEPQHAAEVSVEPWLAKVQRRSANANVSLAAKSVRPGTWSLAPTTRASTRILQKRLQSLRPTISNVNKRRAVRWAIEQKQMPHIAVARDVASATVLQDKPDLATEKLQWLQRHDQECGGLYGVLPLCIGLPVRATDHLDRQRGILKGCKGTVVGWSSARDAVVGDGVTLWNTLPEIVYVRFQTTATWHLTGLPEANVYPVPTCKRVWFLDRQKKYPQLRVWRAQFPLAPGFAITAHVAQGQTVSEGVTTDLNIGLSGNPFTAYVAFTRVPGRDKLLLFRPFHAKLFQRGVGIGRELLLQVLRGESVNWRALLDAYCEERGCCICRERKQKDAYIPEANGNATMTNVSVENASKTKPRLAPHGSVIIVKSGTQRQISRRSTIDHCVRIIACA